MPKKKKPETFGEHLGAVVDGKMRTAGLTQIELSEETGIKHSTLGRRIRGANPMLVSDLLRIAAVVDVPAGEIAEEALRRFGGLERLMSEADGTPDDLAQARARKAEASSMSTEDLEEEENAATHDPNLDTDEADPT